MSKTILVTGATSGIGKAIATVFAKNGYNTVITGRRKDRLLNLKKELEDRFSGSVTALVFDVRNKDEVQEAFRKIENLQLDILVNNAGLASGFSTIDEGDTDDWDLMIDTNIRGLLYVTRACLPLMKAQGGGHIFNIGSTAGKAVYKNGNVYCATKFAVDALSQTMRIDLLQQGIKVTSINPGMVTTEFSLVRFKGDEERAKKVYEGLKPLQPDDVADIVFYAANLPKHVCINDLTVTATQQANSVYSLKNDSVNIK